MPFKSAAQRRFMHAQRPDIAEKWEKGEHSSKKNKKNGKFKPEVLNRRMKGGER